MPHHHPSPISQHPDWTDRYLAMLGAERGAPSLDALSALTRAHQERVFFGTITSLLRKQATPVGPVLPLDHAALLDAWERGAGSGVCFEVAEMVYQLLTALGYDARITLATVGHGWPAGHQAVVVTLDGRRYLVDVGNGAPFFEPIPLDGTVEVQHVSLGYRFRPGDAPDRWIQDRCIGGEWDPFCTYDLGPANAMDREAAYQRHHVPSESWVVSSLLLVRCAPEAVTVLRDTTLTHYTHDGKRTEAIEDESSYSRITHDVFGAPLMPIGETRAALAAIQAVATTPR